MADEPTGVTSPATAPAGLAEGRPRMLVGTFHKTGTMLMRGIFMRVARRFGYRVLIPAMRGHMDAWDLCLDAHSGFRPEEMTGDFRGIVVIRDPRDVIISGALYHTRLDETSTDRWVHVPMPAYGGMSYQQRLRSLPSDEARFLFEMDNMGRQTLGRMAAFTSPRPSFRLSRFEDLVTDLELFEFHRIFAWLGLPGDQIGPALGIAWSQSVFSGGVRTSHVRSARPQQWQSHFTPALHDAFRERFGDIAERLGYPAA